MGFLFLEKVSEAGSLGAAQSQRVLLQLSILSKMLPAGTQGRVTARRAALCRGGLKSKGQPGYGCTHVSMWQVGVGKGELRA